MVDSLSIGLLKREDKSEEFMNLSMWRTRLAWYSVSMVLVSFALNVEFFLSSD